MISALLLMSLAAHAADAPKTAREKAKAKAAAEAPPAPAAPDEKEEGPEMQWGGQYGSQKLRGHRLITEQGGWEKLWRWMGQPAPPLDFAAYNAVAVFVGEKPTGGWSVTFEEPVQKEGDTVVSYRINPPRGFTTQAFSQAFAIKAFPKPAKGDMLVMEAKPK